MQQCGVPEALKLTFSPGANSSKEQDVYPCPCSGTKSIPAQGLGSTPNISGNKNLVFSLYSTPEPPVDFLQQQLGLKNCQCVTQHSMHCTLGNYCEKAALYNQSCLYKCYHTGQLSSQKQLFPCPVFDFSIQISGPCFTGVWLYSASILRLTRKLMTILNNFPSVFLTPQTRDKRGTECSQTYDAAFPMIVLKPHLKERLLEP